MAMGAALVAAIAKIDLQCCELSALQWRENALNDSHRLQADEADSSRQLRRVRMDTLTAHADANQTDRRSCIDEASKALLINNPGCSTTSTVGGKHSTATKLMFKPEAGDCIRTDGF